MFRLSRNKSHIQDKFFVLAHIKKLAPKSGKFRKNEGAQELIFTWNMYLDVLGTKCKKSRA